MRSIFGVGGMEEISKRANVAQQGWKIDQSTMRSGKNLPGAEIALSYKSMISEMSMHLAVETRLIDYNKMPILLISPNSAISNN